MAVGHAHLAHAIFCIESVGVIIVAKQLITASEFVSRWTGGVSGKQDRYRSGIQRTNDWADRALAASDRRNAGLQRAIADGSIDRGITDVGNQGWKDRTLAKGPMNWQTGVTAAAPKMQAAAQRLLNMIGTALNEVDQIPRGDIEQNYARARAFGISMQQQKLQK